MSSFGRPDATGRSSGKLSGSRAKRLRGPPKDEPWYHVLVDGSTQMTYVAERNLEADPDPGPIQHPLLGPTGEVGHPIGLVSLEAPSAKEKDLGACALERQRELALSAVRPRQPASQALRSTAS